MKYNFNTEQMCVDGHTFWIAKSLSLKGCVGQGDTAQEAIDELENNELEWLDSARKYNIPIPTSVIKTEKTYSGKLSLRISPFLHEVASHQAEYLEISLNQYITDAISHYNTIMESKYSSPSITTLQTESTSVLTQKYQNVVVFPANIKETAREE